MTKPLRNVWDIYNEVVEHRKLTRTMIETMTDRRDLPVIIEALRWDDDFCTRLIDGIDLGAGYEMEAETQPIIPTRGGGVYYGKPRE